MFDAWTHPLFWWAVLLITALTLGYRGAPRSVWTAALGAVVAGFVFWSNSFPVTKLIVLLAYGLPALAFNLPQLRRGWISKPMFRFYRNAMPEISQTERDALEAGTTWWDAQLFTGKPDWRELLEFEPARLSEAEQAFLDGPVDKLCGMLDDYQIDNVDHDLPQQAWDFIKSEGFFGMMIPEEFGGKGFSAYGHAAVVMKIATRSISAALTVMIPNSVGPAKLLLKYGTDEQKQHYLPRLANAEEIPCFALTGPEAGSDAGALPDTGVVCKGKFEGKETLGIKLNFDKRYITLGPVATVLGLAFKLRDPDGLLGDKKNLGITLALVPSHLKGVEQGKRHNPMHMAFLNGPLRGKDVFIPLDYLIGGQEFAGKGWRMLMECLTDGRSISLPALSTASAKVAMRTAGAYARVREQFKTPIGRFEGIQEALARIGGNTYTMDAARLMTLAALDAGHKPSVIAGIVKYNLTERARSVINDAIEVHGGAAICLGPRNPLGQLHSFPAVGVTVEGHNILTRNLMVFGQGAIRCHPYLLTELEAVRDADEKAGLKTFDKTLQAHLGFGVRNACRSLVLALTGGRLARAPVGAGSLAREYQRLERMAASFAIATDVLLLSYRGSLKRRERISGRMADVLSQLYLATAALKHFNDQGRPEADLPLVRWAVADALHKMQTAFDALLENVEPRPAAWLLKLLIFPLGRHFRRPSDTLEARVAGMLIADNESRERMAAGMYNPTDAGERLVMLETAMRKLNEAQPLHKVLRKAVKAGEVKGRNLEERLSSAVEAGVLKPEEAGALRGAAEAQLAAIQVDEFDAL